MNRKDYHFSRPLVYSFIACCVHLIHAVTDSGVTSVQPTPSDSFSSQTAAPETNGTENFTGPTGNGTVYSLATTVPSIATEAPSVQPVVTQGCLCDLTPDFCDIGCCCDTVDCGVANLSTVFTGCPQKAISGVCIEKWLMFRANVDLSTVTVTDSLFCVQPKDNIGPSVEAAPQYPALGNSYYFVPPEPTTTTYTRDFYRVDDVILTYFSKTLVRGLLRQPSPGVASALCATHNPAKFLRSLSLSCSREVTLQSCTRDPSLNAHSYFKDLNLIKNPILETDPVSDVLIPVTPLSDWPAPSQQNNFCVNVVQKVEFIIGYTGRGEVVNAKVNVVLMNVDPDQLLLQTHSVQFQLTTTSPTPGETIPAVGLRVGSPVVGRYEDAVVKPLTVIGLSQSGVCSSDPSSRTAVLFAHNTISGCTFTSLLTNCTALRTQIYSILQGLAAPDVVAMNSNPQPDWTRVITEKCLISSVQEPCQSGCILPHTLSVRVLWARQGLLELPQNYILGVKYVFYCSTFKCPVASSLALTTEVTFVDTTVYPKAPSGVPEPQWMFPFGFFTRGTAELDGHIVPNSSESQKMTWSLILSAVVLKTALLVL